MTAFQRSAKPFSDAFERQREASQQLLEDASCLSDMSKRLDRIIRDVQHAANNVLTAPEIKRTSFIVDQFLAGVTSISKVQIRRKPAAPKKTRRAGVRLTELIPGLDALNKLANQIGRLSASVTAGIEAVRNWLSPANLVQIVGRALIYAALVQCVVLFAPLANIAIVLPLTLVASLVLLDIARILSFRGTDASSAGTRPDKPDAETDLACPAAHLIALASDFFVVLDKSLVTTPVAASSQNSPPMRLKPLQQLLGLAHRKHPDLSQLAINLVEQFLDERGNRVKFDFRSEWFDQVVVSGPARPTSVLEPAIVSSEGDTLVLKGRAEVAEA